MDQSAVALLGIGIVTVSTLVAILSVTRDRKLQSPHRSTPARVATISAHVVLFALGVAVIAVNLGEQRRMRTIKEWEALPIPELTLGFELDRDGVERLLRNGRTAVHIRIELSLDRGPGVEIPAIVVNLKTIDWAEPEVRRVVSDVVRSFPDTVGALVGHELKVVEEEVDPRRYLSRISFYHRYAAAIPFLVLESTVNQRAGSYYYRVWYPKKRLESPDGSMYDVRAFVVTQELLPRMSLREALIKGED
ncbi:hypothetical protein ACFLTM_05960 [Candidatus Bipolaricaulota bacterium]